MLSPLGVLVCPKYVPVTEEDMLLHYRDIYGGVFGMVRKHFPGADPEALFGKIFQVGEFAKTCLPGDRCAGSVLPLCINGWTGKAALTPLLTVCPRKCCSRPRWRT